MAYLMESGDEAIRLDIKTDLSKVEEQARWAGIRPGMRVVDVGCGSGKAAAGLHRLVQPGGSVVGIDASAERVRYARKHYGGKDLRFLLRDLRSPLNDLGQFDFVWVRFLLEYFRRDSFALTRNIAELVRPGGILCLLDLDHNSLTHYGLPQRLEGKITQLVEFLEEREDFDPFVGRKLYAYLYDLGYESIDVRLSAHHLIFGKADERDLFNWMTKVKVAARHAAQLLQDYEGGHEGFLRDVEKYFLDRRRFIYTPLISVRGVRPAE